MSAITLEIFGSNGPEIGYITWSPVPLTVSGTNPTGNKSVTLRSRSIGGAISRVEFLAKPGDSPADEITVILGADNTAKVFVAGKFQLDAKHNGASEEKKDIRVEATWDDQPAQVAGSLELMIRVRKNANDLSNQARKDFTTALATLNGVPTPLKPDGVAGTGVYVKDFVSMHVGGSYPIAHGDSMFLPWHRLYLLDLERLLQEVNPAVTLPYWKFDEKAEKVFTEDFMGETKVIPWTDPPLATTTDLAKFHQDNYLSQWKIGTVNGIPRSARFDPMNEAAKGKPAFPNDPALLMTTQKQLMQTHGASGVLGTRATGGFTRMEGAPHGAGHVSFNGPVYSPPTAPEDPIFFLLHCNVDRLWAVWQFLHKRDVAGEVESYPYQTSADTPHSWKVIDAPQWPWHNSATPGGLWPPGTRKENFTVSPTGKEFPGGVPLLLDAIDPFGYHDAANNLGFGYDDVPFDHKRFTASPLA